MRSRAFGEHSRMGAIKLCAEWLWKMALEARQLTVLDSPIRGLFVPRRGNAGDIALAISEAARVAV